MGDLRESIVGAKEERPIPISIQSLSSSSSSNPSPSSVGAERWAIAEKATNKIICQVQPTAISEEKRKEVIDYVQRLIRGSLRCEIFPFGSVPLKTYLPDGDIDLTAFGGINIEDALANDLVSVLEEEEQNSAAEFVVKDVQLIRAEVKLVKCIVQNIVVDISFNQLGGLCTLCFLEQVDRLIGKDHLFKRSIILIKAWCYYESRILGAHHGLISTYALETLVLYIFHLFHSTLNGPLAVLYKFLDYFSNFDWDNYCISLNGPIRMSSLPELLAEIPETGGVDLLLSNDFLRYCLDAFSVPSRRVDVNSRAFPPKHLNIVDPLKENNNLGRSVSKGNLYRIRSAFTYGARKLGRILLQPDDNIADELCKFFSNTLDRHGSGLRPDVQGPLQLSSPYGFGPASPSPETESFEEDKIIYDMKTGELNVVPDQSFYDGAGCGKVSRVEMKFRSENGHVNGLCSRGSMVKETGLPGTEGSANGTAVLGYRCSGDAKDLATSKFQGLCISNGSPTKISAPSAKEIVSVQGIAHYAPHHYITGSLENGKSRHEKSDPKDLNAAGLTVDEGTDIVVRPKDVSPLLDAVDCAAEDIRWDNRKRRTSAGPESMNTLTDLCGDYDSHYNSLQHGRCLSEYASNKRALPQPPPPPPPSPWQFQSNGMWHHSSHHTQNGFSLPNGPGGVIPKPVFYPINGLMIPGPVFGLGEVPKPRGTGTYFPNTNRPPYQKLSSAREKTQAAVRSPREANMHERSSHEASQVAPFPIDRGLGIPAFLDTPQSGSPHGQLLSNFNGFNLQSEGLLESEPTPSQESSSSGSSGGHLNNPSSLAPTSSQGRTTRGTQRMKPVLEINRLSMQSAYHLKDDEDFPPLSV